MKTMNKYQIPEIGVDNFDWQTWRRGLDIWIMLCVHPRWYSVVENSNILRKYAVGYIPGYKLFCRPEPKEVAVMFLINETFGWTHLRKAEFERVFSC